MAILGLNLPTLNGSEFTPEERVEYGIPSSRDKMAEVTSSMAGTFGNALPFEKIGAISPTMDQMQSNSIMNKNGANPYSNAPLDNILKTNYKNSDNGNVTAQSINQASPSNSDNSDHKIKLVELVPGTNQETYTLYFEVMPEITEARNVSYEAVAPAQFPGAFQKYKNTESTQWTINATLISRTTLEATKNLEYFNRLRAWTMPYYGDVTGNQYPERLGAPPPVLVFSGFRKHMIGPVPVVVTSLNWTFPKDVDYIPANSPTGSELIPFPTVFQISVQLVESFSTTEFNNFSLNDFRTGDFGKAFSSGGATSEPAVADGAAPPAQSVSPNAVTVGDTTKLTPPDKSSKSAEEPVNFKMVL